MLSYQGGGFVLQDGQPVPAGDPSAQAGREQTLAYRILRTHDHTAAPAAAAPDLHISFDALISHDITYVGIVQTARASGLESFPLPYAMTNCHNSLCAVGGTINEDDHAFGLSAAKRYGGIYVPANQAVIHQFAREMLAGGGRMVLGSDSHTRYGCFGTMAMGEGGGELVKQLLQNTYDIAAPEVVLVWLEGEVPHGVGPHDVAIALVAATFPDALVKNKVLEFAGPGLSALSMDFRTGIDVMTTETSCLSSIWQTDQVVRDYYQRIGRGDDFRVLTPSEGAYYDALVRVDLSKMEPMIALPFHPSRAVTVHELQAEPERILRETEEHANQELSGEVKLDLLRHIGSDGKVHCDQGVIVGCAGGLYENIAEATRILEAAEQRDGAAGIGDGLFNLSVYPASAPLALAIASDADNYDDGAHRSTQARLLEQGAVVKPAFCGPCFGAGDTPANNGLSIRHATRNFANREGSKPGSGQIAAVALMDARSIAATAANGGVLTAASDIDYVDEQHLPPVYDLGIYRKRCYFGYAKPEPTVALQMGPNITDWPEIPALKDNLLLHLAAVIQDEVTTTDELIPSGETSSYRSNPLGLAEFTLSRRVPAYVATAKQVHAVELAREAGDALPEVVARLLSLVGASAADTLIGSAVFARKPGDGSAREQAASCQKVLGGMANVAYEYATKRYRSNCINWGLLPFLIEPGVAADWQENDHLYVPGVRQALLEGRDQIAAERISVAADGGLVRIPLTLRLGALTDAERQILACGCLINYYRSLK
jgi:aconitate hydratase